jgi:hypothetical protein
MVIYTTISTAGLVTKISDGIRGWFECVLIFLFVKIKYKCVSEKTEDSISG